MRSLPHIILWFTDEEAYLKSLKIEHGAILKALEPAEKAKICTVNSFYGLSLDTLLDHLEEESVRNNLAVFHYAGHASRKRISMTDRDGEVFQADPTKLLPILKDCRKLQLIFLNGCYTFYQAERLTEGGVPIVIGSTRALSDRQAWEFAEQFYRSLVKQNIAGAYRFAECKIEIKNGDSLDGEEPAISRGLGLHIAGNSPFGIKYQEDLSEKGRWSLAEAANDPLFGLPPISDEYRRYYSGNPFGHLKVYTETDAAIFFGRGHQISRIFRSLCDFAPASPPVLTISGATGVGKSSLLRAGLVPRLSTIAQIVYLKWRSDVGLSNQLCNAIQVNAVEEIPAGWKQLEDRSNKPLVLILDQVEELLNGDQKKDWLILLQVIQAVFRVRAARPQGKILLGYRTEYDQVINEALREIGLGREDHLITRLDRDGIVEIVHGLDHRRFTSGSLPADLEVEDGLGDTIASFLLQDPQSPLAPVLQILLTRLWDNERQGNKVYFTKAGFVKRSEKGIWLNEFFKQQMDELKNRAPNFSFPIETSGLALDLLDFHITERSTGESHALEELIKCYGHHDSDLIRQLLLTLENLGLLATNSASGTVSTAVKSSKDRTAWVYTLAHDTLGPVVREAVDLSALPGQHARRLLKGKMIEYQLDPEHTLLEGRDLEAVLAGRQGMRAWTAEETILIDRSIAARAARDKAQLENLRRRRRSRSLTVVLILALLSAGTLAFTYFRRQTDVTTFLEAKSRAGKDPSVALQAMLAIYHDKHLDEVYKKDLYEIYERYLTYHPLYTHKGALNKAAFSQDGRYFALSDSATNTVYIFNDQENTPLDSFTMARSQISDLRFDRQGCLFIAALDRRAYRWCMLGQQEVTVYAPVAGQDSAYLRQVIPNSSEDRCFTLHNDDQVRVWSKNTGTWIGLVATQHENTAIAQLTDPAGKAEGIWIGAQSGQVQGYYNSTELVYQIHTQTGREVTSIVSSTDGNMLLIGNLNGSIEYWRREAGSWKFLKTMVAQQGAVKGVFLSPGGQWLAAAYKDGSPLIWDLTSGEKLHELDGQSAPVHSFGFRPADHSLLTADNVGHLRSWQIPYPQPTRIDTVSEFAVLAMGFDGSRLNAVDKSGRILSLTPSDYKHSVRRSAADFLEIQPAFNSLGNRLVVFSNQTSLTVYDLELNKIDSSQIQIDSIRDVAVSRSCQAALSDVLLYIWTAGGKPLWQTAQDSCIAVAITDSERYVVTATDRGKISWFDMESGNRVRQTDLQRPVAGMVPASTDEMWLLDQAQNVLVLSPAGEPCILEGGILIAPATEATVYAALDQDNVLRTRSREGYLLESFTVPQDMVITSLGVSPDGQWIAAGTRAGNILFWRTSKKSLETHHQ